MWAMKKPMTGVRVLEVAQFTFVPSAGAVLADWGADVIKIENPVTSDEQRGAPPLLRAVFEAYCIILWMVLAGIYLWL